MSRGSVGRAADRVSGVSSIKDVARLAGVSYTTVSHVINGTRKVSVSARDRVLQAVADCGYVPSQAARSLRGGSTQVLGILVPDVSDPFCAEITLGAERALGQAGYAVVLANTQPGQQASHKPLDRLLGRHVDGLLVVAGLLDHRELLERLDHCLRQRSLPMVFIDHDPEHLLADALVSDAQAVARQAVQHLLDLGHTRVACISGPLGMPVSEARLLGWRQALAAAGIEPAADWLVKGDFGVVSGYLAAQRLLGPQGCRPTAVFACNDLMAMGVLRAAAQLGVAVPERCSVIGVDGIVLGEYVYPALTTMGESLTELGARAAQVLLRRLGDPGHRPSQRQLRQPGLIRRESTGPCPVV
ncbi:MAG: LacI family transcriptional regulator [Comamonadaceae bacterium]|nr:LacI family transcriptional regulator [Comamonadaceae bacterium]